MKTTRYYPYLLVLPTFLLVMLFLAYPLAEVFRVSFTDTFLLRPTSGGFVGFKTYAKVLSSEEFLPMMGRTFIWMGHRHLCLYGPGIGDRLFFKF